MKNYEKLSDFKRDVKNLVRGAVRSNVLGADGKYTFTVVKNDECKDAKTVTVTCENGGFAFAVNAEVVTRIYNKVTSEFFAPIVTQFEKLAKVKSIAFKIVE